MTTPATRLNGHGKVIAIVAASLLAAAIIGIVSHFLRSDIHQTPNDKENQSYRWFSKWWDEKFEKDIKPEFEELKELIEKQCSETRGG